MIWRSHTKWRKEKGDLERPHPREIFLEQLHQVKEGERRSREVALSEGKKKGDLEQPHPWEIFPQQPYHVKEGEMWSGEAASSEEKRKVIWRGRTLERFFQNNRTKWSKGKGDLEKLYQVKERERWYGKAAPLNGGFVTMQERERVP